jgi:hypothetical protein
MCSKNATKALVQEEVYKWYEILSLMVRQQVDGTSTKNERTTHDLTERCQQLGCKIKFDRAMEFLEDRRIVQKTRVRNIQTDEVHTCFTLGHDVLGLALRGWRDRREGLDQIVKGLRRKAWVLGLGSLFYTAVITIAMVILKDWFWLKFLWAIFVGYSVFFLLISIFPKRFLHRKGFFSFFLKWLLRAPFPRKL